ncbi:hypothetical protein JCM10207_006563 [Rhodosporidiobolus poonsookiae]
MAHGHGHGQGQVQSVRNRYTTLTVIFSALGSITYGYTSAIISTTLAQPSFLSYTGLDTATNANAISGAITGLYQAGGLIGNFASGWTSDKFGRRLAIFIGAVLVVIGGVLQTASVHIGMFMVGRFISALGVGQLLAIVPTWQSEVADAGSRGLLVGMHGVAILIGYTSACWIGVAFYYVNAGGAQWRVPLAIQLLWPLCLAAGIFFVPESPRWLLQQGRTEEALTVCKKLRQNPNDPNELVAHAEFEQIKAQREYDVTQPSSWLSLLVVPSYRKRCIIGFLTMAFAQGTGTIVMANYGPVIYGSLGFGDALKLILVSAWNTTALVTNYISALIMDRFGRVPMLTFGFIGCLCCLIGATVCIAVGSRTGNSHVLNTAVFFIFGHEAIYGCGLDDPTYVYVSEIWPNHIRSKGVAVSTAGLWLVSLIFLSAAPTAFANIEWKYYFPFICCTVVACLAVPKFWPEVNGLSLEETAAKFGDHVEVMAGEVGANPLGKTSTHSEDKA